MSEIKIEPKTEAKVEAKKGLPTDEVTLVDDKGSETTTTRLFYDKQKDSFELAGLTIKK